MKLIWNSLGVAALVVAAQLGVAQALGIIHWNASFEAGDPGWKSLLTWVAFIYATAVLGGAAVGRNAVRRPGKPEGTGVRVTAALCAAVGAGVAVTLVWLSARDLHPPVHVYPNLVVVTTSGAGIVAGLIVAVAALSAPPVAGSVRALVAWTWLVAIGCAAAGLATHRPFTPPRLAVIDAPSIVPEAWWSGPNLMIGVSAVLGFVVAAVARWGGAHRFGVAVSGLVGPLVVAAAYLIAGRDGGGSQHVEPFLAALIGSGAGLCASVLVAAVPGRHEPAGPDRGPSAAKTPPFLSSPPVPPVPERALVGEIVDERAPVTGALAGSVPGPALAGAVPGPGLAGTPDRFTEEEYSSWIRDLGPRQRA
jgi:hypothetical protein